MYHLKAISLNLSAINLHFKDSVGPITAIWLLMMMMYSCGSTVKVGQWWCLEVFQELHHPKSPKTDARLPEACSLGGGSSWVWTCKWWTISCSVSFCWCSSSIMANNCAMSGGVSSNIVPGLLSVAGDKFYRGPNGGRQCSCLIN